MKYAIIRQQMNLLILVSISFSSRIEVNIMVVTTAVSYTAGGGEGVTVNHLRLASGLDSGACLLSRLWEAEWFGHPSDRSGVPSTVYILVHLLRHLLRMAEVCCGDRHSAGREKGRGEATEHNAASSNVEMRIRIHETNDITHCIMTTML